MERGEARRGWSWIAWTAISGVACIAVGLAVLHVSVLNAGSQVRSAAAASAAKAAARRAGRPWRPKALPPRADAMPPRSRAGTAPAANTPRVARAVGFDEWRRLDRAVDDLYLDLYREAGDPFDNLDDDLPLARRDRDALLSPACRAWLDLHATGLETLIDMAYAEPPPVHFSCGWRPSDPIRMEWYSFHRPNMERYFPGDPPLVADAVRWADDGEPALAQESLEAVLQGGRRSATEVSFLLAGLIRRVRPANAAAWAAWLDELSSTQELLDVLNRRAMQPRDDAPLALENPTFEVLHDDLPESARKAVDAVLLAPIADARWARRSRQILAVHDDLVASAECLTSRTDPAPADPEWGDVDWRAAWGQAVIEDADLLLTREVLRVAHPEAGIAPRPSPCPDWSIEVETLPDGTRRVKAVGSVRALAARTPGAPPLEYELPP